MIVINYIMFAYKISKYRPIYLVLLLLIFYTMRRKASSQKKIHLLDHETFQRRRKKRGRILKRWLHAAPARRRSADLRSPCQASEEANTYRAGTYIYTAPLLGSTAIPVGTVRRLQAKSGSRSGADFANRFRPRLFLSD